MENASKALIMVGEILIAMMVVGIIVYSISNFGKFSSNMNQKLEQNTQIEFNNRFLKFERRIDITADEIVGIINFAKNTNDNNELYLDDGYKSIRSSPFFVDVFVENTSMFSGVSSNSDLQDNNIKFLNKESNTLFMCNVQPSVPISGKTLTPKVYKHSVLGFNIDNSSGGTGLVKKIVFEKTNIEGFDVQHRDEFTIN